MGRVWLTVVAFLTLACGALAGDWSKPAGMEGAVSFRARVQGTTLTIEASHFGEYHSYALDNTARGGSSGDMSFSVSGASVKGKWQQPEPNFLDDPSFPDYYFKDVVNFTATLIYPTPAPNSLSVTVDGQVCNASGCVPLQDIVLSVPVDASDVGGAAKPEGSTPTATTTAPSNVDRSAFVRLSDGKTLVSYRAKLDGDRLIVQASHATGFHTYAINNKALGGGSENTEFALLSGLNVVGQWLQPVPKKHDEPEFQILDFHFYDTVTFVANVERDGSDPIRLQISGMVCDEGGCEFFQDASNAVTYDDPLAFNVAADGSWSGASFEAPLPELDAALLASAKTATSPVDYSPVKATATPGTSETSPQPAPTDKPAATITKSETQGEATRSYELQQYTPPDGKTRWVLPEWGADVVPDDAGWLAFILLCIGGGLIALVMPCVYPMIPITVSFFGKQAEQSKGSTTGIALIYGLGLIGSYTGLGFLLTAISDTGVTDFGNNPVVATLIGVFFLIFGVSMLGAFELRLPTGLMQKFNMQGKSNGAAGAFLLGTTFAVTSMACTVPVVALILAYAAQGEVIRPLVGMLVYSATVATPFVALGMVPGLLKKMPRAGGWMNSVKVVFGFIELAAAAEFIGWARLISREAVVALWIAFSIMTALYLLGMFRSKYDAPGIAANWSRMCFAALFLAIAVWLNTGLHGQKLGFIESFLINETGDEWILNPDLEAELAEAKSKKLDVFIDFTGKS